MLDYCGPSTAGKGSCGANYVIWSNTLMPTEIGVAQKLTTFCNIGDVCGQAEVRQRMVMRCSDRPHDFIYKYVGVQQGCGCSFCSMD